MGHRGCKLAWTLATMLVLVLLAGLTPAYAIGFHFSPLNISIQARPGQIANRTFNLTLAKDAPSTHFKAHVQDWWRSADNRQTFYAAPGSIRRSCGLWCSINPVEATVKPGETLTIRLSIRVPDDIKPGGYWAALTVDEVPDPLAPEPSGIAMVFRGSVSIGIFIEIPPAVRSAKLAGIQISEDKLLVKLCNDGDIPLRVNGAFEFYRLEEDKLVATVKIGGEPLLPDPINTCEFSVALPSAKELPSGKYKVRAIMDVGLDYLLGAEKQLEIIRANGS